MGSRPATASPPPVDAHTSQSTADERATLLSANTKASPPSNHTTPREISGRSEDETVDFDPDSVWKSGAVRKDVSQLSSRDAGSNRNMSAFCSIKRVGVTASPSADNHGRPPPTSSFSMMT